MQRAVYLKHHDVLITAACICTQCEHILAYWGQGKCTIVARDQEVPCMYQCSSNFNTQKLKDHKIRNGF